MAGKLVDVEDYDEKDMRGLLETPPRTPARRLSEISSYSSGSALEALSLDSLHRPRKHLRVLLGCLLLVSAALSATTLWALCEHSSFRTVLDLRTHLESWRQTGQEDHQAQTFGVIYPAEARVCDLCDCSTSPPSAKASLLRSGPVHTQAELASFLRSRMLDVYCPHVYASDRVAHQQIKLHRSDPEKLYSWNLSGLTPAKSTLYMYTKTAAHGKTGELRLKYLRRHAETIARHRENVGEYEYHDGVASSQRQTLWIIVEDSATISEDVADMLAAQDQPYIYFAFGPTHRYGNAQLNAALALINALSGEHAGHALGHGPVISVDDDAEIHEDLLDLVWKVRKIGIWPAGNLAGGFERPEWEDGKIVSWENAASKERRYPLDWGSFSYRSSTLEGMAPRFMMWDNNGGESDFVSRFVSGWDELENICEDPTAKDCHLFWHDQPIEISHLWLDGIPYPF